MITEDEAKTKWCPHARVYDWLTWFQSVEDDARETVGPAFNRLVVDAGPPVLERALCLGSACMAWRTQHQWRDNAQQPPDWVSYPPYAFEPGDGQERDAGYCGLAGRPE